MVAREIVVPCAGDGHRVRLAQGRRFWAAARCPRCGAPVDPWRWRRIVVAARGLLRPVSNHVVDRLFHGLALAWSVGLLAATVLLWWGSDRWWPATVLLFGPRWVLLLPLVVLLPWALVRDRGWMGPLAVLTLIALGPLVGLHTGWRRVLPAGEGPTLRVVTFNVRGGDELPPMDRLLAAWDADIVVLQECGGPLRDRIRALGRAGSPLATHAESGLCLLTRLELLEVSEMDRSVFRFAGGAGLVHSYRLGWGDQTIVMTDLHLETQRAGLELIRQGRVAEAIAPMREKSFLRSVEQRAARRWVDGFDPPRIVAGDFNTPAESPIYRAAWGDWTNAFDARGVGLGGTRMNGWIRARIDHVLVDRAWRVVAARVGDDVGSDHLPLIVTLRLR